MVNAIKLIIFMKFIVKLQIYQQILIKLAQLPMKADSQKLKGRVVLNRGEVVFKHFKVIKKIGTGAFGEIFLVEHQSRIQNFALKVEPATTRHPQLLFEAKLYKYLHSQGSIEGIPHVYAAGVDKGYNMMLMDYLGKSLEDFFVQRSNKFTLKTVLLIGLQLIQRIKAIHKRGFLHRDIKPDNLLMGVQKNKHRMFIIDMGLSKKYLSKDKGHIPYKQGKQLTGTARYASVSTHKGIEQSRRDDIQTIGYVMIYFLRGILPWQNMKANTTKAKYEMIMFKKISTSLQCLCQGLPNQFVTFVGYARGLKFEQQPNYGYLSELLIKAAKQRQIDLNKVEYDWEKT